MNKLREFMQLPKDPYDRIIRFFFIGQTIMVIYMMIVVVIRGVTNGRNSGTTSGLVISILTSMAIAVAIALFFRAINIGFQWWENLSDWLEKKFMLLPALRRSIIAVGVSSAPFTLYWAISNIHDNLGLQVLLIICYGLILPAAIISLAREDRIKDKTPLAKYISRAAFAHDPQAELAKAFTVIEHRLKEKLGNTNSYSTQLINEAYEGKDSKLMLIIDGKDRTSQLRDLLSGAYALLRNPRHHSLIEDDEPTAYSIYALAGLLLNYVEASEPRNKPVEK